MRQCYHNDKLASLGSIDDKLWKSGTGSLASNKISTNDFMSPWHPTRNTLEVLLYMFDSNTCQGNKSHLVWKKTCWFNGLIMGCSTMFKLVQDWTAKKRWNVVFLMWVLAIIGSASCFQLETQATSVKVTASKTHPYHQTSFASLPSFDVNSNRVFQGDESGMWSQASSECGRFWYHSTKVLSMSSMPNLGESHKRT